MNRTLSTGTAIGVLAVLALAVLACTAPNAANVEATANAAQATVIAAATIGYGQITPQDFQASEVAGTVMAINVQQTLAAQGKGGQPSQPTALPPTITAAPGGLPTLAINTPVPTSPPAGDQATITGKVCYPAGGIPPLNIYAQVVSNGQVFSIQNPENTGTYSINVPGGNYFVFAYPTTPLSPDDSLAGAYSAFVTCGLTASCTDHSLIGVLLQPGQTVTGVDICDWYAPPGTFPTRPR